MALESTRIWIFPRASSQSPSRIFVEQDRAVLPITQSFFKKTFVSGNVSMFAGCKYRNYLGPKYQIFTWFQEEPDHVAEHAFGVVLHQTDINRTQPRYVIDSVIRPLGCRTQKIDQIAFG